MTWRIFTRVTNRQCGLNDKKAFWENNIMQLKIGATVLGFVAFTIAGLWAPVIAHADDAGDAVKGKKIFLKCAACHSLDAGVNKVGPSLHGIIGRTSASIAGFNYSDAMKGANLTWDTATIEKYITSPKALVPGNKMAFPGLPKPEDRANLIAYLKEAAGS
jgi:cytochrome c